MYLLQDFVMVIALKTTSSELSFLELMKPGDVNYVGKKTCLVCNSIRTTTTFTTEACGETFKIRSGTLNFNLEKVLYLLQWKVCGEAPYVGKAKTKFWYRFNNFKSKQRAFRKGNRKIRQKLFHDHYCLDGHLGIDDCSFTLFEQCETQAIKWEKSFGSTGLKLFTH